MKIKEFKNMYVDAGNISAVLNSYLDEPIKKDKKNFYKLLSLKKVRYRITLEINESWDGRVSHSDYIEINKENDYLVIGDLSYYFNLENESLKKFTEDLDYGHHMYGNGVMLNTGGDGSFDVVVKIKSLKYKPKDKYLDFLKKLEFYKNKLNRLELKNHADIEKFKNLEKELFSESIIQKYKYSEKLAKLVCEIQFQSNTFLFNAIRDIPKRKK